MHRMSAGLLALALTWLTPGFVDAVAARCGGEASFAVAACSCTVKNRIEAGWSPGRVLSAYYAPDVPVTEKRRAAVRDVLAGEASCPENYYYLWSTADLEYIGLDASDASAKVCSGKTCVFAFGRDALWDKGE